MNLTTRTTVAIALAFTALAAFAGPSQAALADPAPRHAAQTADPDDEPEDVEVNEAGRPDLGED
ncbi:MULTISPECIES: hypothetical protein [Streptomyces]|uniref:Uncharacterized protein n=2 Tax=Streptomyces TaxID=1883 RepID=A0ABV9IQI3_9ACTN